MTATCYPAEQVRFVETEAGAYRESMHLTTVLSAALLILTFAMLSRGF